MRIAVLSDIHGNYSAFKAALKDIEKLGIDKYIIAGDQILDFPKPNEVLETIRGLDAYVIKGNRENYILDYHNGKCSEWKKYKQMSTVLWTYETLKEENLKYIGELPSQLKVNISGTDSIRVVHGSPLAISEELYPNKHLDRLEKACKAIEETVLICGHTHEAWVKEAFGKLILNPGSLGVPFNKNSAAEYAVLTWKENHWTASIRQIDYTLKDFEEAFNDTDIVEKCKTWCYLTLESIKAGRNVNIDFINQGHNMAEKEGIKICELVPNSIWDKVHQLWFKEA
ncbi:metallophosphoesterase family protein [Clostridium sp. 19966]|uniref:metallophosphoesterase family protein n=1 Tax=Clostridium sp. 19966 TaxID=2768166 RepID=UPI0028DE69EA|nr:YfcE family phosphodiesterase [Clostridium sp. 19966]MDT8715122.1 metallophosphoesterase family protein [Clostridium sp. 19966]